MAKKRKISFLGILFRIALAISAIALVFSYFSIFINPAKLWFPSLFGLYYIPIVIVNVLLLSLAVVRWSASAWLPIIVLVPSFFFLRHFVNHNEGPHTSHPESLKVITYNVGQYASSDLEISKREIQSQISTFIRKESPDIVCFQEFFTSNPTNLDGFLPEYPHKQFHLFKVNSGYYFGNMTVSKFPILSEGKITFKGSTNLSIYADITTKDDTIRIYNSHLESYSVSPTAIIKQLRSGSNTLSEELKELHGKMRTSNIRRATQVDSVLRHIQKSKYHSIICGDFNDTPMSYTYQQLRKVSKDTFIEAGSGFSSTYSFLWPLLRIDYILVPEEYEVTRHSTPRNNFSDHYPVITEIHKTI